MDGFPVAGFSLIGSQGAATERWKSLGMERIGWRWQDPFLKLLGN